MKTGKLFEDALKKSGIDLHPGYELKVKVKKKGGHLELIVDNSKLSPLEDEILKRSSRMASLPKPYKPKISTGERIRYLRKVAKLSLSALAVKTGISKGSLGSIENRARSVGLNVLKRIAKALEVDISVLVS